MMLVVSCSLLVDSPIYLISLLGGVPRAEAQHPDEISERDEVLDPEGPRHFTGVSFWHILR